MGAEVSVLTQMEPPLVNRTVMLTPAVPVPEERTVTLEPRPAEQSGVARRSQAGASRQCGICGSHMGKVVRHLQSKHLPWWFVPETACWECGTAQGSYSQLENHCKRHHAVRRGTWPLPQWLASMRALKDRLLEVLHVPSGELGGSLTAAEAGIENSYGRTVMLDLLRESQNQGGDFSVNPPTSDEAMLFPSRLAKTLAKQTLDVQVEIADMRLADESSGPERRMQLVDSHCHMRQLMDRCGHWDTTPEGTAIDCLVDNRVFPRDWRQELGDTRGVKVCFTAGIHPRFAQVSRDWRPVFALASQPECRGVGECGLDEKSEVPMEEQLETFKRQVGWAEVLAKPLVLHVRGLSPAATTNLYQTILDILQAKLQRCHPVYLHSYSGTLETYVQWRSAFPGLLIGVSWLTTRLPGFDKLGRTIALDLLALETDAPYLTPLGDRSANRPGLLDHQARKLADLRNLPVAVVVEACRRNAKRMFRL